MCGPDFFVPDRIFLVLLLKKSDIFVLISRKSHKFAIEY